jgi:hypothetical protein
VPGGSSTATPDSVTRGAASVNTGSPPTVRRTTPAASALAAMAGEKRPSHYDAVVKSVVVLLDPQAEPFWRSYAG